MRAAYSYGHAPFCARRCSYCDCAIAVRKVVPVDAYVRLVERELDLRYSGSSPWPVKTLYLGGGTPSHLGADGISRLLAAFRKRVVLEQGAEVTIEANPHHVPVPGAPAGRS